MMKSIEARDDVIKDRYRAYKKKLMTPNEIDEFLAEIEKQDELETDNSKKKIHSDTITATTEDADNKKILTRVPSVEGAVLIQREMVDITDIRWMAVNHPISMSVNPITIKDFIDQNRAEGKSDEEIRNLIMNDFEKYFKA